MSISENISRVEQQIAAACRCANRARNEVRLMAVSKTHPPEAILEAYAAGLRLFGENRVQEYASKQNTLDTAGIFSAQPSAAFHLIGPLQTNKIARAADLFSAIDTVDSLRLAERLNTAAEACEKTLSICIEIKLSPEETKHGLAPGSAELSQLLERLADFSHLQTRGLMTVPPYADDPEEARPYFRRLRELRDSLARRYSRSALDELSMGMSHDFSVAIEEGATLIRIGTAIFGARSTG
jgi:pyridoxal phosphate enzyme (YggS family)